jgi:hypothetical protein
MCRRGRRAERTVVLEARAASVLRFEDFIDRLDFLTPRERYCLKLAGSEILDNLVKHASPIYRSRIYARATRRGASILLGFFFRSPSFAAFAGDGGPWSAVAKPLFDPAHRRWRGIGLVMCRNLARRVDFRPGERMDRIFLEFEREK